MNALIDLALRSLTRGPDGYELDANARARLTRELASAPSLKEAVESLVALAFHLETREGAPRAAEVLLAVAATATEALRKAPRALDVLTSRGRTFTRFEGTPRRSTPAPVRAASAEDLALLKSSQLASHIALRRPKPRVA